MRKFLPILTLFVVSGTIAGCSKPEVDPMTQPRAATGDPMTTPQEVQHDRAGNIMVPHGPTTGQPAPANPGGQTDRMGNPTGG